MPITYTLTSALTDPAAFMTSASGTCSAIAVPYAANFSPASLCNFSKALAGDITNSLATTTNANFSLIATTINQIIQYLNCEGFGDCILTGPSGCCPDSQFRPAEIRIKVPALIGGGNSCYVPQATGGSIVPVTRNVDNGDNQSRLFFM